MIKLLNENLSQEEKDRLWDEIWRNVEYHYHGQPIIDDQPFYDLYEDDVDYMLLEIISKYLPSFKSETVETVNGGLTYLIQDWVSDMRNGETVHIEFNEPCKDYWKSSDPATQYLIDCMHADWADVFVTEDYDKGGTVEGGDIPPFIEFVKA